MKTTILIFVPDTCTVYPEMCKHVKGTIVDYFGKKHAEVNDTYPVVTITECEVTEKDLDEISSKINKNISLICVRNPESNQIDGNFINLNKE